VSGKVRLDVNVTKELSLFIMGGYGTDDNSKDDAANFLKIHGRTQYKPWGGNWAVWGGGTYKFNDKTSFNVQASADDDKNYALGANVAYTIVPGFTITTEVDWDHFGRFNEKTIYGNFTHANKKDSVGGIVRFQRNF
jgi:hypothetical protein